MKEKILILDFGSQYTQLIARRIREWNVYSEIVPYHHGIKDVDASVKGIILSGSPFSVTDAKALHIDIDSVLGVGVPVLGVCYGAQYIAQYFGGTVERSLKREYGKAHLVNPPAQDPLFKDVPSGSQVWMSHGDTITKLPAGFEVLAGSDSIDVAAFKATNGASPVPLYCLQFHPEVAHSLDGSSIIRNFLFDIAGCEGDWTPVHFVDETIAGLQEKIGQERVLLALSGGVDSSVAALLLHKAIGSRLVCFFVDNGLLRKNEYESVLHSYKNLGLNVVGIDAKQRFWDELAGKPDPEEKRKIIGRLFIEIFEEESEKIGNVEWLAQGTIYPDVIESVSVHGPSVTIKSHHNVGGLPEKLKMKIVEPLRMLFKDEVRRVGAALGLPEAILHRHPFPGPGLAIRVLGEITPAKVALLQEADAIFINALQEDGLYSQVWQAGAVLLPVYSVGVMGDERTYEQVVALRAVNSTDGMTAEWSKLPYDFLARVSSEIINQVKGINRVVYDISTKPPATIEWE